MFERVMPVFASAAIFGMMMVLGGCSKLNSQGAPSGQKINLKSTYFAVKQIRPGNCYFIKSKGDKFLTLDLFNGLMFSDEARKRSICVEAAGNNSFFLKMDLGLYLSANDKSGFEPSKRSPSGWEEFQFGGKLSGSHYLKTFHNTYLDMNKEDGKAIQSRSKEPIFFVKESLAEIEEGEWFSIETEEGKTLTFKNGEFVLNSEDSDTDYFQLNLLQYGQLNLKSKEGYEVHGGNGDKNNLVEGVLNLIRSKSRYHSLHIVPKISKNRAPKIVTMSTLGDAKYLGRFGNQMLQYIFLKSYAKRNDLEVQTGDWVGKQLYGLTDSHVTVELPKVSDISYPLSMDNGRDLKNYKQFYSERTWASYQERTNELRGYDLVGYFQFNTSFHADQKEYIRSLFKLREDFQSHLDQYMARLRQGDRTVVVVQIRMGDIAVPGKKFSKPEWYLEWLDQHWGELHKPVLYVASDSLDAVLQSFARFNPVSIRDFKDLESSFPVVENDGPDISHVKPGDPLVFPEGKIYPEKVAGFYPDFHVIANADVVLVSPSTFTSAASMLNKNAKIFMRADLEQEKLFKFDPWNIRPN